MSMFTNPGFWSYDEAHEFQTAEALVERIYLVLHPHWCLRLEYQYQT